MEFGEHIQTMIKLVWTKDMVNNLYAKVVKWEIVNYESCQDTSHSNMWEILQVGLQLSPKDGTMSTNQIFQSGLHI